MSAHNQKQKRRVVVTGMGAVTGPGHSMDATWNAVIEKVSIADKVTKFPSEKMPTKIGYEVRDYAFNNDWIAAGDADLLNDAGRFGIGAAMEAWQQSGLDGHDFDRDRFSLSIGSGMGSTDFEWTANIYAEGKIDDPSVLHLPQNFPNTVTTILRRLMGARGGGVTVHTACASSGQSLGEAFEMIAYGERDVVLTGGCDSMINPFHMAGFCLLGALSKRNDDPKTASRPFDAERDGFVLGEGAAMMVFEDYDHAVKRGANIIAEVCGYGVTESAYRITDLHPEGHGPIQAMQMAVDDAGIDAGEVGYINAHGTSTLLNDRIESLAIHKVFGDKNPNMRVSSTKSVTGHLISAAGALECALAIKSLQHQVLPPSTNLFEKDSQCLANVCDTEPQDSQFEYALSNSVGFGGSNTALVVRRYQS